MVSKGEAVDWYTGGAGAKNFWRRYVWVGDAGSDRGPGEVRSEQICGQEAIRIQMVDMT